MRHAGLSNLEINTCAEAAFGCEIGRMLDDEAGLFKAKLLLRTS
jgi:hypothetical protein